MLQMVEKMMACFMWKNLELFWGLWYLICFMRDDQARRHTNHRSVRNHERKVLEE